MTRRLIVAAAVGLLLAPAAAAHVTVQPNTAPAGGFVRLDVRVPNERDNASTVRIDMQLPPRFTGASYEPVPGWTVEVRKQKLAKPVTDDEGTTMTEHVSRIVWTGDGKQGKIAPGQFQDFPISVQTPDEPGSKLTFKALQIYSNGEIVRWIGAPDSDEPAPQVDVTSASEDSTEEAAAAATSNSTDTDNSDNTRANVALGFGLAGLAVGIAALALVLVRRGRPASA